MKTIFIAIFLVGMAYGSHVPLVPVFAREEIRATYLEIGTIGMANYLPYVFTPAFVGILLDRFNRSIIMSIGIAISASSIFALSLANNVLDLMLIRTFSGLAHAFLWPAATSIVTGMDNNSVRSISRFTMFWVTGYMLGPLIGSILFESFGFRLLFQYSTIFMIIALLLSIVTTGKRNTSNAKRDHFTNILTIVRSNIRIYILVIYYSAAFGIILAVFPAYIKDYGIDEFHIGVLYFIFGLARLLTLTFTHRLVSRSISIIAVATILISLSMLIAYSLVTFSFIFLALIILGFSFSIYFPITLSMVTKGIPDNMLGRYVGVYETIFGIGWTIGPIIAGMLADAFVNNTPYLVMFIIGIILPLIMLRFNSK